MAELHTYHAHRDSVIAHARGMDEAELTGTHIACTAGVDVLRELARRGVTQANLEKLQDEIQAGYRWLLEVAQQRGIALPPIEVVEHGGQS